MYILDSDTLGHLHFGNARVIQRLAEAESADVVATTVITRIELLRGRFDYLLKAANGAELLTAQDLLRKTDELLTQFPVIPVDERAADAFNRLLKVKGLKKIGRADLLIASIALAQRAILVTRNTRHFGLIPDLQLENWVD